MTKSTREAYGEKLRDLAALNKKIVILDADLAKSTKSVLAKESAPERFFDMGIAEADMIGHAAGFAASGYIPFASSFAMFTAGRAWEQIRNSIAYPHLNVKICGSHSGITVGEDGVSHQATEDIAIMRVIPGMEIYVPCDENETRAVVAYVSETKNPSYIRTGRVSVNSVYETEDIDIQRIHVLRKGDQIAVFACGICVQSTLEAAALLKNEGISITVVDVCAIKPCDYSGILNVLHTHKIIFTVEEHSVLGGLGGLISEIASSNCPRWVIRIGVGDIFTESGDYQSLLRKNELDSEGIYKSIKTALLF